MASIIHFFHKGMRMSIINSLNNQHTGIFSSERWNLCFQRIAKCDRPCNPGLVTGFLLLFIGPFSIFAAEPPDTSRLWLNADGLPIKEVAQMISKAHKLNIVLDPDASCNVTLHLSGAPLMEGLRAIVTSCGLSISKSGSVIRIGKQLGDIRSNISWDNDLLDIDIDNVNVIAFLRDVNAISGMNIIYSSSLSGKVSGKLGRVPFFEGMKALLQSNGFNIYRKKFTYVVEQGALPSQQKTAPNQYSINCEDQTVSLTTVDADLQQILLEIGRQCELQIVSYGQFNERINATLENVPVAQALTILLGGTNYTFVQEDSRIIIGLRDASTPSGKALAISEIFDLKYLKADDILPILPRNIPMENVKVIKEQNALMITGSSEEIVRAKAFIDKVDVLTPQVLIDALVVEYSKDATIDVGLETGIDSKVPLSMSFPNVTFSDNTNTAGILKNANLDRYLGPLSKNFYVKLRLLEQRGKARVLARPSITVLNGNQASIDVGQTQYHRIIAGTSDNPIYRFEPISFGIRLNITPWISRGGQITTVVSPEISNAMGINNDGYPNVFRRAVNTTVRINNGETLVLGGLLRSEDHVAHQQIPFLGRIPLLGYLFKSTKKSNIETNLVIYITPRIISPEKWR
jgi:type IV pilus assembly protein PilQ